MIINDKVVLWVLSCLQEAGSSPEKRSHRSPLMLSGIPLRTRSLVFSVRYMHTPCPYSAKWFFHDCSFRNSFA